MVLSTLLYAYKTWTVHQCHARRFNHFQAVCLRRLLKIKCPDARSMSGRGQKTKPTKWHVRPVKTQISLGIRPVWSVFAVRMKKALVFSYPLSARPRLWSDWADAQADLSLRWGHMPFCRFCHALAQMIRIYALMKQTSLRWAGHVSAMQDRLLKKSTVRALENGKR